MVDETTVELDSVDRDQDLVINAIHLRSDLLNKAQLDDKNLKWIYDLKALQRSTGVTPVVTEFLNKERKSLFAQFNRLFVLNNNLFREFIDSNDNIIYQYVVPKQQRPYILAQCHDNMHAGHLGFEKTRDRIIHRFYWTDQLKDIESYVKTCEVCQQMKTPHHYNQAPLVPILPSRPGELVTTDLLGPLPRSNGGNIYILVVIDHFTKWVELFAMNKITAEEVAQNLMLVFYRHGIPETLLSDQGTNYQASVMNELCELFDIHKVRTTPYHPQCDGITERFNRTIQTMLASYVNKNQTNWDTLLPALAFAYNTSTHSSTKCTPFELVYGRKPKVPLDLVFPDVKLNLYLPPEGYVSQVQTELNNAFEQATNNRDIRMERNKLQYDRKVRVATFALTDQVWVLATTVGKGLSAKLSRKWVGPYRILSRVNEVTYELQTVKLPRSRRIIVHQNRLMKCFTRNYTKVADMVLDTNKSVATQTQDRIFEKIRKQLPSTVTILPTLTEEYMDDEASLEWEDDSAKELILDAPPSNATTTEEPLVHEDVELSPSMSAPFQADESVDIHLELNESTQTNQDEYEVNDYHRRNIRDNNVTRRKPSTRTRKRPQRYGVPDV